MDWLGHCSDVHKLDDGRVRFRCPLAPDHVIVARPVGKLYHVLCLGDCAPDAVLQALNLSPADLIVSRAAPQEGPAFERKRPKEAFSENGTGSNGSRHIPHPDPRTWKVLCYRLIKNILEHDAKQATFLASASPEILLDGAMKDLRRGLAAGTLNPVPELSESELDEEMQAAARAAIAEFIAKYAPRPEPTSAQDQLQELLKLPSPTLYQYRERYQKLLQAPWPIKQLFCLGCVSLLTAKKGVGKSTLFRTLIICLLNGWDFLGREIPRPVRVLYIPIEGGGMPVILGFEKASLDPNRDDLAIEDAIPAEAKTLEQRIQWVKAKIINHAAEMVLIDTLGRFSRIGGNDDYGGTVEIVGELEKVARETGAHIIYAHHTGKNRSDDAELTGSALGSAGIESAAQAHIHLRRRAKGMVTIEIGDMRVGEALPESVLVWDEEHDIDTLGETWKKAAGEMLKKTKGILTEFFQTVDPDQWWTMNEVMVETNGNKRWTGWALSELATEKVLDKEGKGVKGSPFRFRPKHAPEDPKQGKMY